MESTARNVLKILYDRKCGAVVMLSGLMENGMVGKRRGKDFVGILTHPVLFGKGSSNASLVKGRQNSAPTFMLHMKSFFTVSSLFQY